jgi:chromosome segregation ATPase
VAANDELIAAERTAAGAQTKLDAEQANLKKAELEAENHHAQLAAALTRIEMSRQELQDKSNELAVLKSKGQDTVAVEAAILPLQKLIDEQELAISKLRKLQMERNSSIAVVQSRIADLANAKGKAEKVIGIKRAGLEAVKKTLADAKAKWDEAKEEIARHQKQRESVRIDLLAYHAAKQEWVKRNEELQKQTALIDQQRLAAQSALEAEVSSQAASLEKVELLKKQIEQLKQTLAKLENQNSKAKQSIADKQASIEALGSQIGQLKAEQQSLADQLEVYRQ